MIQRFACRTTMRVIGRFSISTDINPWRTFFIGGKVYDVEVNKKGSRNKYIVVDELGEEHSYTGDFPKLFVYAILIYFFLLYINFTKLFSVFL